jgi:hypothetical protein
METKENIQEKDIFLRQRLSTIYKKSILYPAILLLPFVLIYASIENRHYKSEWFTRESVIGLTFVAALVYVVVICLLSLTIFFNRREKVYNDRLLSALSWFLLPGAFICLVIGKTIAIYIAEGTTDEIIYAVLINAPFVVGLVWGFYSFRQLLR